MIKVNLLANNTLSVLKQKTTSNINTDVVSFVIFTSPKTLILPAWIKIVDELIKIKMLNILLIDEARLLINFGLYFRRKFLNLREVVFNKLIKTHVNN